MMESNLTQLLLNWYDANGRDLPWRVRGGAHPIPYHILVSEVMLQQTTVQTVGPYFDRFIKRFPDIHTLANAALDDVYGLWQGLGYYSRARSLHRTAQEIVNTHSGQFPSDKDTLLKLPGIGPYTAASFLSLAFNKPEAVIDGNVIRVLSRMHALTDPVDVTLPIIREKASALTSFESAADYASAIMDLGATVCTPKNPNCSTCPWADFCLARQQGTQEQIPVLTKLVKKVKEEKAYLITNKHGDIFIRKRPGRGLLSGLYEIPWTEDNVPLFDASLVLTDVHVTHVFSHFKLILTIHTLHANAVPLDGMFVPVKDLEKYPASTLMKKVYQAALKNKLLAETI